MVFLNSGTISNSILSKWEIKLCEISTQPFSLYNNITDIYETYSYQKIDLGSLFLNDVIPSSHLYSVASAQLLNTVH